MSLEDYFIRVIGGTLSDPVKMFSTGYDVFA